MLAYLPFLEETQSDVRPILHGCIEAYHTQFQDPEGLHSQGTIAGFETAKFKAARQAAKEAAEEEAVEKKAAEEEARSRLSKETS